MCVYQCVAPPCTDLKRGPKSRLLLNLIPGHHFTMFSTSLYSDIRTKEASQKRICEFFVPIQHIFKAFVCANILYCPINISVLFLTVHVVAKGKMRLSCHHACFCLC